MSANRSDVIKRWISFEPVIMLCLGIIIGLQASVLLGNVEGFGYDGDPVCPCLSLSSSASSVTTETNCHDEIDNDADTLADCEDSADCSESPYCAENCTNGIDDDGDEFIDCADLWCLNKPECAGSSSSGS
jgi:hypothetical protein